MNPRTPHLNGQHEPSSNCIKIFCDKCCHAVGELSQSDALRLAASWLVGAATFPACIGFFQKVILAPLKISSVSPMSSVMGICIVSVSGITATHVTSEVWNFLADESSSLEIDSPEEAVIVGGVSLAVFLALRGKLKSVLPSNVLSPGVFAKGSLPASENYATNSQRLKVISIGKRHGCHTCGARINVNDFIADHQPPLAVIRRQQSSKLKIFKRFFLLLRRRKKRKAISQSPQQRFYPQCNRCSTKQLSYLSAVARGLKTPNPVVTHVTSLRLRHLFLPFPLLVLSAYKFCALGLG